MFHEILHSWGFSHNIGNDPNQYADRGKAILALEDAMRGVVKRTVTQRCGSTPLSDCAVFGNYAVGKNPENRPTALPLPSECAGNPNPPTPTPTTKPPVTNAPSPTPTTKAPLPITEMPRPVVCEQRYSSGEHIAIYTGVYLGGLATAGLGYAIWECVSQKSSEAPIEVLTPTGSYHNV
ncbi:MAG: hypothetical protein ACI9S8_000483 [Chlamydiales bacterium]|jgi:hypothetical protein